VLRSHCAGFRQLCKALCAKSRDLRNSAVRDYRGTSGNVTLVEMCTHLATEKARLLTLHLTVGAPEFYPDRREGPVGSRG
jgi:hypothetical protein